MHQSKPKPEIEKLLKLQSWTRHAEKTIHKPGNVASQKRRMLKLLNESGKGKGGGGEGGGLNLVNSVLTAGSAWKGNFVKNFVHDCRYLLCLLLISQSF